MQNRLALLTGVVCLCVGCNKTPSIPTYNINPAIKAAFNFKVGTYWVYRDSLTGNLDSFYVNSILNYIGAHQSSYTNKNDYYIENTLNSICVYNIMPMPIVLLTLSLVYSYNYNMIGLEFDDIRMDFTKNTQIDYRPLINYPYDDQVIDTFPYEKVSKVAEGIINDIYISFTLNGQMYSNVADVSHQGFYLKTAMTDTFTYNDRYFICPNIGIIKMRLNHPQDTFIKVWELIRYNIVK